MHRGNTASAGDASEGRERGRNVSALLIPASHQDPCLDPAKVSWEGSARAGPFSSDVGKQGQRGAGGLLGRQLVPLCSEI